MAAKPFKRRMTQTYVQFPVLPNDIDRELLAVVNNHGTEDDDAASSGQMVMEESKSLNVPNVNADRRGFEEAILNKPIEQKTGMHSELSADVYGHTST